MYIYLIKWCEHWIVQNESFQVNPPYIRRSQCIFENHNLSTLLLKVEPYSWWWYHNHWGLTQNGFSQPKFKTKHTKCINFWDNSIYSNLPQKRVQLHVRIVFCFQSRYYLEFPLRPKFCAYIWYFEDGKNGGRPKKSVAARIASLKCDCFFLKPKLCCLYIVLWAK